VHRQLGRKIPAADRGRIVIYHQVVSWNSVNQGGRNVSQDTMQTGNKRQVNQVENEGVKRRK
jgi:hypothetical protein